MKLTVLDKVIIVGHGTFFAVESPKDFRGRDEHASLYGLRVEIDGKKWQVMGIETNPVAVPMTLKGKPLGLLCKEVF